MNGRVTGSADRIELQGLSATGYHGVLEEERRDGQLFVVDLVLELDLGPAARRDDLALTVDYARVAGAALSRVTGPPVRLIETLAESIAADVLSDDAVDAVEVTVHKPHAPIGHLVGDVRVRVRRERGTPAVVALGGNVGDRRETLTQAVDELAALPGVSVESVSPLVESDAVGGPEQPRYLNAVVLVRTSRSPWHLLSGLHSIEARHGRVREVRWGLAPSISTSCSSAARTRPRRCCRRRPTCCCPIRGRGSAPSFSSPGRGWIPTPGSGWAAAVPTRSGR